MANVGILRGISFGVSGERRREVAQVSFDETIFFEQPKKVNCGPRIGEVELRPDGSVIVDALQLVKYQEYERQKHLSPAKVENLADGKFLLSVRK